MASHPPVENEVRLQERRHKVGQLYLQGRPQFEIGRLLGVSQTTVSNDLEKLRCEWLASAIMDFDERKAQELAKLDKIEAEAWKAWERSQQDAVTTQDKKQYALRSKDGKRRKPGEPPQPTKFVQVGSLNERKVVGQVGNPAFLDRVAWCVETRCRIFGFVQPDKGNTNTVVQINWGDLILPPPEEETLEARLIEQARQLPAPPPKPETNGAIHEPSEEA